MLTQGRAYTPSAKDFFDLGHHLRRAAGCLCSHRFLHLYLYCDPE